MHENSKLTCFGTVSATGPRASRLRCMRSLCMLLVMSAEELTARFDETHATGKARLSSVAELLPSLNAYQRVICTETSGIAWQFVR